MADGSTCSLLSGRTPHVWWYDLVIVYGELGLDLWLGSIIKVSDISSWVILRPAPGELWYSSSCVIKRKISCEVLKDAKALAEVSKNITRSTDRHFWSEMYVYWRAPNGKTLSAFRGIWVYCLNWEIVCCICFPGRWSMHLFTGHFSRYVQLFDFFALKI